MKKRKSMLILGIILLLFGLGIGYAFLTTTLSINGVANVDENTWNIYWDNVQVTNGSVSGNQVTTAPTIDTNKTTVSFQVNLKKPGEFYEFTIDAKNDGSIDAMIDTITKTENIPTYLNYTVTYSDDVEIAENQLLSANSKETYKVRLEYRTDINASDLPSEATSLSLTFGVTYVQADSNAFSRSITYVYTVNNITTQLGEAIPREVTQYNTPSEAMASWSNIIGTPGETRPFYLKHGIQNGIVAESYVVFVVTEEMASTNPGMTVGTYALRGLDVRDDNSSSTNYCKAEYYNSSTGECLSPYYASNKATLLNAFGSANCKDEDVFGTRKVQTCEVPGLGVSADTLNMITALDDEYECYFADYGISTCIYYMY